MDAADYARLSAASTRPYTMQSGDWQVYAAPSAMKLATAGATSIASESSAPTNFDVVPTFGNPFPGTELLASEGIEAYHTVTPMNQPPFSYPDGSRTFALMPTTGTNCAANPITLAETVPFPENPVIGGTALSSDGLTLTIDPSQPLQVTWSLVESGQSQWDSINVYELLPTEVFVLHLNVVTDRPSATIDPSIFVDGHDYILNLQTHSGQPNAADGDFETLSYPLEVTSTWSRAFHVAVANP
jgi:hypothetical protein